MKILVINSGSSSIKYQLFEMPEEKVIAKGLLEKIGEDKTHFIQKSEKETLQFEKNIPDHENGIKLILEMLTDKKRGVVDSIEEISGVGHRVVHGGEEFTASVLITAQVIDKIQKYADLAPLHNPPNLMGIIACKNFLPLAVQVASFDTAFHHSLPPQAYLYPLPYELYKKYEIRKYGFHGTSHLFVAKKAASLLNKPEASVITCHLGNGCSITAVEKGFSVDTSMGFTPLEGLVMGTRCGDIDPAITFYLMRKGYSVEELNTLLNKKSGLLGISGISNDMRNLAEASKNGEERAKIAIEIFCYRLKKYIGAYLAVLGKTDAIVFTGGIGENNCQVRSESLRGLEPLGIKIDEQANLGLSFGQDALISKEDSPVKVFVIPTNEELQIALDTFSFTRE
jgi:acetate kinase